MKFVLCRMTVNIKSVILLSVIFLTASNLYGQQVRRLRAVPLRAEDIQFTFQTQVKAVVQDGDTVPVVQLPTVWVYPPMNFKNKREERFYWRLVRDVKVALPLSKEIRDIIAEANDSLMKLPTKRERTKYMRHMEKKLYSENYDRLSKLTFRQGTLLIRLVDRECQSTGFEIIKSYMGSFTAGFYQFFAKMFGASLKTEYGDHKDDATIERIINMVESGQL